jgi:GAF domain-containing protein
MEVLLIILGLALTGAIGSIIWGGRRWAGERRAWAARDQADSRHTAELEATIDRLSTWLEALPRLAAAIRAETAPEAVARALANGLGRLLPEHRSLILGRQADGGLHGLAGHGLPDRFVRGWREEPGGPVAAIAARAETSTLDEADWQALGRLDLMIQLRGRVTAVPLLAGGREVGLILLSTGRPDPLPHLHQATVELLAGVAAAALAPVASDATPAPPPATLPPPPPAPAISADARSAARGLKAQLEHALSGVSALLGADQAITWIAVSVERAVTAPADERTLLDLATDAVTRGLLADAGAVFLWEQDRLVLASHTGLDVAQAAALVHEPGEAVHRAAQERAPATGGAVPAIGHRAHLAVPILRGQELLGVVCGSWRTPHAITDQDIAMASIFAGLVGLALDNARLFEEMSTIVERSTAIAQDREVIVAQFLTTLGALVDGRHAATANHSRRVADYAAAIARQLGLPAPRQAAIRAAALIHDLGYLHSRAAGPTAHPVLATRLLAGLPFLSRLMPAVLHHHEHFDGSGIPEGLAGTRIPLEARILAVANAFDVLTSPRAPDRVAPLPLPEQLPCSEAQALARIQAHAGQLFDPHVVAALATALTKTAPRQTLHDSASHVA